MTNDKERVAATVADAEADLKHLTTLWPLPPAPQVCGATCCCAECSFASRRRSPRPIRLRPLRHRRLPHPTRRRHPPRPRRRRRRLLRPVRRRHRPRCRRAHHARRPALWAPRRTLPPSAARATDSSRPRAARTSCRSSVFQASPSWCQSIQGWIAAVPRG